VHADLRHPHLRRRADVPCAANRQRYVGEGLSGSAAKRERGQARARLSGSAAKRERGQARARPSASAAKRERGYELVGKWEWRAERDGPSARWSAWRAARLCFDPLWPTPCASTRTCGVPLGVPHDYTMASPTRCASTRTNDVTKNGASECDKRNVAARGNETRPEKRVSRHIYLYIYLDIYIYTCT
jgi:hypothetical protein